MEPHWRQNRCTLCECKTLQRTEDIRLHSLCRLVHNLVKRGEDVVCKLNLCHRRVPVGRKTNGKPDDALLRQRRVEHSRRAVAVAQIHGRAEHPTECDVLAKHCRGRVGRLHRSGGGQTKIRAVTINVMGISTHTR